MADLEIIHSELRVKDLERVTSRIEEIEKTAKRGVSKQQEEEVGHLNKIKEVLEAGTDVRKHDHWNAKEIDFLNTLQLLTAKPVVYLVNLSEKDYLRKKNKWLPKIHQWVQEHGGEPMIPLSVAFEQRIADMPEDEKANYLKEVAVNSQMDKIITTGFKAI